MPECELYGIIAPYVVLESGELGRQGDVVVDLEHRLGHQFHGAVIVAGFIRVQIGVRVIEMLNKIMTRELKLKGHCRGSDHQCCTNGNK